MSSLSRIKCWGDPLAPQDFLRKHALPQLVRVAEEGCVRVHGPRRLDLERPLLLHRAYVCEQVHARCVDRDRDGAVTLVGPPLLLPDSFPGWFAVITEDGHTAGHFSSVSEVASAQVPYFLSRDQTQGYREDLDSRGKLKYTKVKIKSGEVLQFLGAYEDTTYSSRRPRPPLRYAKVVDRRGDLLFLPFPTPGRFFSVAGPKTRSVSHLFRLRQLLQAARLPLTVRLVSGEVPRVCSTGLLRLEWSEPRHVILACAMRGLGSGQPTLLEVDVSSEFRFLRPADDQRVRLSKTFAKMLRHCSEKGESWRQQIKIAHHVVPSPSRRTPSQGSSGDSYEDEDSAVRSSTVKSLSSKSSSVSSNLFKRLRLLKRSWKGGLRASGGSAASGSEDSGLPKEGSCPLSRQFSDFHLYERVRGPPRARRGSWGNSSGSTEILDDDGYVTSDFEGDFSSESSTYDSVCR